MHRLRPIGSIAAVLFVVASALSAAQSSAPAAIDAATIDRWMTELSNWGRWGKDDQRGTVNLITDATRKAAVALVRDGVSVSLSRDADPVKAVDNGNPIALSMVATAQDPDPFAMEALTITFHGTSYTHMDSLAHMFYKGRGYNGVTKSAIGATGASTLAITGFKNGLIGRGVLMDIPRLKGVPYLEPRTAITPADLDAWEKQAGVKVGSGDLVFFRTGRWARRAKVGAWDIGAVAQGPRRRGGRLGRPRRGVPGAGRGHRLPDAPAPADRDGHADLRQLRSRGRVRSGRVPQALGLPRHGVAAGNPRRHRVAAEPDRDVLRRGRRPERWTRRCTPTGITKASCAPIVGGPSRTQRPT
jgi:hypothetical protein